MAMKCHRASKRFYFQDPEAEIMDGCPVCVVDAGGGQHPARFSAGLQRPGSSAAHAPRVAAAVAKPRLRSLHPAQRTCWG